MGDPVFQKRITQGTRVQQRTHRQDTDNSSKADRDKFGAENDDTGIAIEDSVMWNPFEKRKEAVRQERADESEKKRKKIDSLFDKSEETTTDLNKLLEQLKNKRAGHGR